MSKQHFKELLNKHESNLAEKTIDYEKQKAQWLASIKEFYGYVETWFAPFKAEGRLSYAYENIQITEEYIGTYDAELMKVDFAGQKLTLIPVGTFLIGAAKGRIDMEGARGIVNFLLVDKNKTEVDISFTTNEKVKNALKKHEEATLEWKISLKGYRRIAYVRLTEENFFDALMEAVNG